MAQMKMNKHQVYNCLADHPEWFQRKNCVELLGDKNFLTCADIADRINREMQKETDDFIVLRGATLTAMVYDEVLMREYSDDRHCYTYCLIQPIKEDYRAP